MSALPDLPPEEWAKVFAVYDGDPTAQPKKRAKNHDPLTAPTDLPPGKDRIDVYFARAERGLPVLSTLDAPGLPTGVGTQMQRRGQQGQDVYGDYEQAVPDFDDWDSLDWEPVPIKLPEGLVSRLAAHGVHLGNQRLHGCPTCGWTHERQGRCSWCGAAKPLHGSSAARKGGAP